ncbi:MAG: HEPN domain-containing protein [Chloroflexi bacterium]|nr:HEPN domain-containing protein [Chloroflexota bacterium]
MLIENGRIRGTANRAYYAMFHAALAALDFERVQRPRTHAGVLYLFRQHFASTGRLSGELSDDLQNAYELRQDSDYEGGISPDEQLIAELVEKAEVFIEAVKAFVEQGG